MVPTTERVDVGLQAGCRSIINAAKRDLGIMAMYYQFVVPFSILILLLLGLGWRPWLHVSTTTGAWGHKSTTMLVLFKN